MMAWIEAAADLMMAWSEAAADLMMAWLEGAADLMMAWPEADADLVAISSLDKGSEKFKYFDRHGWQIHNCGCPDNKSFSDIIYMMKTYYWPPWPWLMKWWGNLKIKFHAITLSHGWTWARIIQQSLIDG